LGGLIKFNCNHQTLIEAQIRLPLQYKEVAEEEFGGFDSMKNSYFTGKFIWLCVLGGLFIIGVILVDVSVVGDSIGYVICCGVPALIATIALDELVFRRKT
jgi:hypothetical protein